MTGLVALIQEMTGKPVLARRSRNSVYEPHFAEGISQVVPRIFQQIDPEISTTTLVDLVLKARRQFAGQDLRFLDLFPFYAATFSEDGGIRLRPGLRLEAMELNIPIYCP